MSGYRTDDEEQFREEEDVDANPQPTDPPEVKQAQSAPQPLLDEHVYPQSSSENILQTHVSATEAEQVEPPEDVEVNEQGGAGYALLDVEQPEAPVTRLRDVIRPRSSRLSRQ